MNTPLGNRAAFGALITFSLLGAACSAGAGDPGSASTQGEAVSARVDPNSPGPDYVLTPGGYYHKTCIPELEADAVSADEDGTVKRADGSTYQLPACAYPHYSTRASEGASPPTVSHWVEAGVRYNLSGYKQFNADWYVPDNPQAGGGLVYFFPGFQDANADRVIQPVLSWGYHGNYWEISAWSCGGSCPHTGFARVSAGDHINGWISGSNCSNGVCDWQISTKDDANGAFVSMPWHATVPYTEADVALEAYNINQCNQYPSSPRVWMSTAVWRVDGVYANGTWGTKYWYQNPGCNQYVYPYGSSAVGLYWSH